jgi:hypothetical protein
MFMYVEKVVLRGSNLVLRPDVRLPTYNNTYICRRVLLLALKKIPYVRGCQDSALPFSI